MKITDKRPRIFDMSFASVYPLYITKVERKGHTKQEVNQVILWLTGYSETELIKQIEDQVTFQSFFDQAPLLNPNVDKITGSICGYKVQEIKDPLMQKIRFMYKLLDEVANNKSMDKILRK